jgi:glycosyltransferase involved in cell wall biosynthesis
VSRILLVRPVAEAQGAVDRGQTSLEDEVAGDDANEVISLAVSSGPAGAIHAFARALVLHRERRFDCVVTVSPPVVAHAIGYLFRRFRTPWIAHMEQPWRLRPRGRWRRILDPRVRALTRASLVTTRSKGEAERLHRDTRVSVAPAVLTRGAGLRKYVATHTRARRPGSVRILMLGTLNTPHVEHLAIAMQERGHDVHVAGDVTPAYPPSSLPAARVPARVVTIPAIPTVRRLLRELEPDVVHAHWLYGFAFLAALTGARPLVAMAWGSDVFGANRRQLAYGRFALRHAAVAMTDSAALVERLIELGADPRRTQLVNWGVDLTRFTPPTDRAALRARLGLGDGPVVLSPRALTPLYNPETIVAAFELAARKVPGLQLVLKHIGSSDADPGRPLPEGARIVGHVAYEEMADWYRVADICVSIPRSDSSPRSVWEAMACGAACVLSDLPWVHELIEPEKHAVVVPIDVEALSDAIVRLATDSELRARLGSAGRALVEEHRDARREMDRLAAMYEGIARNSRPT